MIDWMPIYTACAFCLLLAVAAWQGGGPPGGAA